MAKTIRISMAQQKEEARLVAGMYDKDKKIQAEMYEYCSKYFWERYRGVFFIDEDSASDIFQNTFVTMWENIERRKIYVSNGILMGKDDEPFSGSILTYFMRTAINKHKEWTREHPRFSDSETEMEKKNRENEACAQQDAADKLYDSGENTMLDIISDVISHMPKRCFEVVTKFYYEKKDLDTILEEIPTITTKDSLKNKKHKCMESLRTTARNIYRNFLNSEK